MNKMSLMFALLSVYAVHASDEKEEEQELLMEKIENGEQFAKYINRVVAYTATSDYLSPDNAFFITENVKRFRRIRYGIIRGLLVSLSECYYKVGIEKGKGNITCRQDISIDIFTKKGAIGENFVLAIGYKTDEDTVFNWNTKIADEWGNGRFVHHDNLALRLATEAEKNKLKQAILDDYAQLRDPFQKHCALMYLNAQD